MSGGEYFHCSVSSIGRGKGQSAVAAAAYRTGSSIALEREGTVADYSRKGGVVASWTIAPQGAPQWATDTAALWNATEAKEKRKDSQLAKEITLALPASLSDEQRRGIMEAFGAELRDRYGCGVTVAIHRPSEKGDDRNDHAHVMMTTREIGPDGWGQKINALDSKPGRPSAEIARIRELAADLINDALEDAGSDERVSHLSFKARGIDRVPTTHLGPDVTAMERGGMETERGDINRAIIEERLRWQLEQAEPEITAAVEQELAGRFEADFAAQLAKARSGTALPADVAELGTAGRKAVGEDVSELRIEQFSEPRGWAARFWAVKEAAVAFWRDESSGTTDDEHGVMWRLGEAVRKVVMGNAHHDSKAVVEGFEEGAEAVKDAGRELLHDESGAGGKSHVARYLSEKLQGLWRSRSGAGPGLGASNPPSAIERLAAQYARGEEWQGKPEEASQAQPEVPNVSPPQVKPEPKPPQPKTDIEPDF